MELEIQEKMNSTNVVMKNVSRSMTLKFKKYWGNFNQVNKLVYVAHILDPRLKLQMFRVVFEELGRESTLVDDMVKKIKSCLYELYNAYKGESPSGSSSSAPVVVLEEAGLSKFQLSLKRKRMEEEATEISNEVDKYLRDPFEKLDNKGFNLLEWWKCNQSWYLVFSKVTKDLFSIPSSTVASENAFSLGGRIVNPFRVALTPKTIEALVCTSDWLRGEEFNFYREQQMMKLNFTRNLKKSNLKL